MAQTASQPACAWIARPAGARSRGAAPMGVTERNRRATGPRGRTGRARPPAGRSHAHRRGLTIDKPPAGTSFSAPWEGKSYEQCEHRSGATRSAGPQHDPDALDGRRAGGQLRSPGHADGAGAGGVLPLAAVPALRSRRSDLAEPRPLRAVVRARVDAALLAPDPGL